METTTDDSRLETRLTSNKNIVLFTVDSSGRWQVADCIDHNRLMTLLQTMRRRLSSEQFNATRRRRARLCTNPIFFLFVCFAILAKVILNRKLTQVLNKANNIEEGRNINDLLSWEEWIDLIPEGSQLMKEKEAQDPLAAIEVGAHPAEQQSIDVAKNNNNAVNFILERKNAYELQTRSHVWPLRGIGYLYEKHGIVLSGQHVITSVTDKSFGAGNREQHSVHIHNALEGNNVNCSDIFIWTQVIGPTETFAGRAEAVYSNENNYNHHDFSCHWEFDFDARSPGQYNFNAKLLEWKPNAQKPIQCPKVTTNASIVEPYPIKMSFIGFKMYFAEEMCCEICSRLAGHCKAWATPIPEFLLGDISRRGCELYFDSLTSFGAFPNSPTIAKLLNETDDPQDMVAGAGNALRVYGLPHHNETSYFLGCGWSYWFTLDFPCLSGELDDAVYFDSHSVNLTENEVLVEDVAVVQFPSNSSILQQEEERMLCPIESESFERHSGRWSQEPWPTEQDCPRPYTHRANIYGRNDNPRCWRRDDLSKYDKSCLDPNCDFIEPASKWSTSLHSETRWYGNWQHDSGCSYMEFSEAELQQCIDRRKLYGFEVEGRSIAALIRGWLRKRFENITLYDDAGAGGGTKVTISTFALLHSCYKPDSVRNFFEKDARNITEYEEYYWVSGYLLSSERALLCTASRMREFGVWGDRLLTPKGYKMINAYDMSAAMTFDTAGQKDGMHINGPPAKMILTKLFHYLCSRD